MTSLGTMSFYAEGGSDLYDLNFINLEFPDGWPWDVFQRVVVPVTSMGVDGTRMRLVRNDAPPCRVSGVSAFATFHDAVNAAVAVMGFKGYQATFGFTAAGVAYNFTDKCYIWDVFARPRAAQVVSTLGDANDNAILETHFRIQFAKVA